MASISFRSEWSCFLIRTICRTARTSGAVLGAQTWRPNALQLKLGAREIFGRKDDLDNSVLELGDLLVHQGPALRAQQAAATIFGAAFVSMQRS
jgi:hypothetical protein